MKLYTLIGPDGKPYQSETKGQFGGHKGHKGYGRLDCRSALGYIAKGQYVKHRVFFADEATAIAAGYRPCAVCMSDRYKLWKQALTLTTTRKEALSRYRELIGLNQLPM